MTERVLEELSKKLTEINDIFMKLTDEIEWGEDRYFNLAKKHAKLEVRYEELKEEKDKLEYDKSYYAKELFERNRE